MDHAELRHHHRRHASSAPGGANRAEREGCRRNRYQPQLDRLQRSRLLQGPAFGRRQRRMDPGWDQHRHRVHGHRAHPDHHLLLSRRGEQQRGRLRALQRCLRHHTRRAHLQPGAAGQLGGQLWSGRLRPARLDRQQRHRLAAAVQPGPRPGQPVPVGQRDDGGPGSAEPRRNHPQRRLLVRRQPAPPAPHLHHRLQRNPPSLRDGLGHHRPAGDHHRQRRIRSADRQSFHRLLAGRLGRRGCQCRGRRHRERDGDADRRAQRRPVRHPAGRRSPAAGCADRPHRQPSRCNRHQPGLDRLERSDFLQGPALSRRQRRMDPGRDQHRHRLHRLRSQRLDDLLLPRPGEQQRGRLGALQRGFGHHTRRAHLQPGAAGQLGRHLRSGRL